MSKTNHMPNSEQVRIWEHFQYCAGVIAEVRKGKSIVLVHNGDAIDGNHHGTLQIAPRLPNEQKDIHVELMMHFQKRVGFTRGDRLYYTIGTEVHTGDIEHKIGEDLGAVETPDGVRAFDELLLEINGKRIQWTHHGPRAGDGPNRGNAFRNWLRNRFYDEINEGQVPPHFIITGHTHDPFWQIFIGRYQGEYFSVRGLISPSWQAKTRYAHSKAPLVKNKIGLQYFVVTKDGTISDPVELLMK